MEEASATVASPLSPTIAILTALTDERAAVERLLRLKGTLEDADEDGFQLATLPGIRGDHSIALPPEFPGQFLAAFGVSEVVSRYPTVESLFFVGCAGGVPGKASIGDVVVARNIVDLDSRKIGPGGKVEHRSSCLPPDRRILQAGSALFRNDEEARGKWTSYLRELLDDARPSFPTWPAELLPPAHRLRLLGKAEIGSSLAVVNDPATRDEWAKEFGLSAFEQEGAALAAACAIKRRGYVMIRGISDYGEGKTQATDDVHQSLASHGAAACLGLLLSSIRPSEAAVGGTAKPPLIIHGFKRALGRTEEVQLRARKTVEIVSANSVMDSDFENYVKKTVSQRRRPSTKAEPVVISEERILDPEKIPIENMLRHLQETWGQLFRPGIGDPQYKIHFGRTGNVGAVAVDGQIGSLFVYTGHDNECLYIESADPDFAGSVGQLFNYARSGFGEDNSAIPFPARQFPEAFDEAAVRFWLEPLYSVSAGGPAAGARRQRELPFLRPRLEGKSVRLTRERARLLIENVGPTVAEKCYGKLSVDVQPGDILPLPECGGLPMFSYGGEETAVESASTCWEKSPNPDELGIPPMGKESLMLARLISFHGKNHIEIPSEEGENQPPEADRNGAITVRRRCGRALLRDRGRPYTITVEAGGANFGMAVLARVAVGIIQDHAGRPSLSAKIMG